jgi:hypothetical protein
MKKKHKDDEHKTKNKSVEMLLNTLMTKNHLLQYNDDPIVDGTLDDNEPINYAFQTCHDENSIPYIEGDTILKHRITQLCIEFKDIFSREVKPTGVSSDIPTLQLIVDDERWNDSKANKAPPRPQSTKAQEEIRKQVTAMLKNNVIRRSQATRHSQVLLTPKPNNSWRFCIDYRLLNELSNPNGWPIPNIEQTLHRIGNHRPKYFGKLDLTSGYHQASMNENSILYTAFICFMGVYEFVRVPFGLKGAPSYFQQMMASIVLAGLIYIICEVYLDDVIVYGRSASEFVERLRAIFERCRKYNVTLHPGKCFLGLTEIEYVGHTLNETGHSFSREKIDAAIEIAKPVYEKQLKTFIGTANYFHRHIRNLSILMKPLENLLENYKKNSKRLITWNPKAEEAFTMIKNEIKTLPKLYFMDSNAEIFLNTDACDHGVGAYLYQIIDGVEQPIGFLSKSFSGSQLNWSTYDQEAYAIYFAFYKFQHLLRDVMFTVRTDHNNLLYIGKVVLPK